MEFFKNAEKRTSNPAELGAGWLTCLFLRYLKNIFKAGAERQLKQEDLFKIREKDSSLELSNHLERHWNNELRTRNHDNESRPRFFHTFLRVILRKLCLIILLALLVSVLKICQPLILQQVVVTLSSDPSMATGYSPYYWATGLCLSIILLWLLYHQTVLATDRLCADIHTVTMALVYKKTLKISSGLLSSITKDCVLTLLSTDCERCQELFRCWHVLFTTPIVLVVATYFLWNELGVSCLVGVGALLLFSLLQWLIGKYIASVRIELERKTDRRVSTMEEIIKSIKITKMCTWEECFADVIATLRSEESRRIVKIETMRGLSYVILESSACLAALGIFSVYYLYGTDKLSLPVVVLTLGMLFALRKEVGVHFPDALQRLRNGLESCKRIEKYLLYGEVDGFDMKSSSQQKRASRMPFVSFDKVTATWTDGDLDPVIKGLTFRADSRNNLVMIIGPAVSGKSSILMTVMNELIVQKGRTDLSGTVAYCPPQPWIFTATIRQNILFGKEFNKSAYEKVVKACGLYQDFEDFGKGDMTLVGSKGATLTATQQARIGLARAVYHDADIYLLDEPLYELEPNIGKGIFERCIRGLLKNKVVLLVTQQIQYLEHATNIICLQNNGNSFEGSLKELSQQGVNLVSIIRPVPDEKYSDHDSAIETEDSMQLMPLKRTGDSSRELTGICLDVGDRLRASMRTSSHASLHTIQSFAYEDEDTADADGNESSQRHVTNTTYLRYFVRGIGWFASFGLVIAMLLSQILTIISYFWLTGWAAGENQLASNTSVTFEYFLERNPNNNYFVFIGLVVAVVALNAICFLSFVRALASCTRYIHDTMFESVLNATMHFFHTNSIGKILNRFSRDIGLLDSKLPAHFSTYFQGAVLSLSIAILNCVSVPYLVILFVPLLVVFILLHRYYMKSAVQIRRLQASSCNPFYAHITATLDGLSTIRAYRNQETVLEEFHTCNDYRVEALLAGVETIRWFLMRADFIVLFFSCCAVFAPIVVATLTDVDLVLTAMSLTYLIQLSSVVQMCMEDHTEVHAVMMCVEYCHELTELEAEIDNGQDEELRESWPEYGLLTAEAASFAYHTTLPYVLKKLFFCVRPNEKVGIVGRTGAGKSSLLNMLFRLGNMTGTVRIDGYPIENLSLKTLRRVISIIPQDPILFSGTLRKNLDPHSTFVDADIWEALEEVQMKDTVMECKHKLDMEITDSGLNFSVGDRQLLCLARAILANSKLLVIDEAATNLDYDTSTIMQRTIREKFKESTVLTVAHRLNTVMISDRVMVLSGGKIVEFDEPYELLQNPSGYFRTLVDQAGRNEANRLEMLAEESKHLRHLHLLQTQIKYPGSHITNSKSKAEIIKHFGTRVVYETTV